MIMKDKDVCDKQKVYDSLAAEVGEPVDEKNLHKISKLDADREIYENTKNQNKYMYDTGCPIPGETINSYLDDISKVDKEKAVDNMLSHSAILKLKAENEKNKKLSLKEKAEKKKRTVEYFLYQEEENFYTKNHYIMDGLTRRRTRRIIEKNYDKGRYDTSLEKSLND